MARSIRQRAVHRSYRRATNAARRRVSKRRAHRRIGDRQSSERRSWSGRAKRQPHAGPRRNRGASGVIRIVKVGGRPQSDPKLAGLLASQWDRESAGLVVVHGGGDEVSALQSVLGGSTTFVGGRRV